MRVLIVGCGYVGLPLGAELVRLGHEVFGLKRSASGEQELIAAGIKPLHADIANADDLRTLPSGFDWVVNCVASGGGSKEDYERTYLQGTRNLLKWLSAAPPRKYIYTSSTSVYAQNDGSIVTEDSPTEPSAETAKVLVATEKLLLNAVREKDFPAVILRLSGIYGPGRGYWLQQFLQGEARIEGAGDRFLNMIHREDVIGTAIVALEKAEGGSIFNVSDSEPATQRTVFEWLAQRLNKPLPPVIPAEAAESRRRGATSKRISNLKLRNELGYGLKFPTFREGYEAELQRLGFLERSARGSPAR
jgi:nucleoside-diphosphate-sugar epimerase